MVIMYGKRTVVASGRDEGLGYQLSGKIPKGAFWEIDVLYVDFVSCYPSI